MALTLRRLFLPPCMTPPLLLAALLLPKALLADEVVIKGAGSVTGRIVEQTGTMVTVDIGGGVISVPMSHVAAIRRGRTDLDEYDARLARLGPHDLQGWRELARWASRHRLEEEAARAFETVLAIDPDDPEARAALGFARLDGAWVPREEAYRSRGLVRFDGAWMTVAEAQMRRETAAAEAAVREAERQARADDLERLKEEVRAAYAAEAARDAQWRAEGAAWFYTNAYGCGYGRLYGDGYDYGYANVSGCSTGFRSHAWRRH